MFLKPKWWGRLACRAQWGSCGGCGGLAIGIVTETFDGESSSVALRSFVERAAVSSKGAARTVSWHCERESYEA